MGRPPVEALALVHIEAPCTTVADAQYRSLVQAYLAFQPTQRLDLVSPTSALKGTHHQQQAPRAGDAPFRPGHLSLDPDSRSLSFRSAWDNASSPPLPLPLPLSVAGSFSAVIPDSQPSVAAEEVHGGPQPDESHEFSLSGLDEDFLLEVEKLFGDNGSSTGATVAAGRPPSPDLSLLQTRAPSPDLSLLQTRPAAHSFSTESVASSTPPRPPLSQRATNAQQQLDETTQPSGCHEAAKGAARGGDGENIPSSLPEEAGWVFRGNTEPPASPEESPSRRRYPVDLGHVRAKKRPCPRHEAEDGAKRSPGREARDEDVPRCKKPRTEPRGRSSEAAAKPDKYSEALSATAAATATPALTPAPTPAADPSLRIIPPSPPVACHYLEGGDGRPDAVGTAAPASLVTAKLAKLARDLRLSHRFRPDEQASRAVRPLERGFWRLDTTAWPAPQRRQAWAFLSKYVGRGDAGWHVWCTRGGDSCTSDDDGSAYIRLYCFAAVAGHTYLLLYRASQRQILATGAVWLDSAGKAAITVPPRKGRKRTEPL